MSATRMLNGRRCLHTNTAYAPFLGFQPAFQPNIACLLVFGVFGVFRVFRVLDLWGFGVLGWNFFAEPLTRHSHFPMGWLLFLFKIKNHFHYRRELKIF